MTKVTKTSVVVDVMVANSNLPMGDVLPLIDAALLEKLAIPFKAGYAREWYVWVVQKKLAPGVVVRANAKAAATPKVPKSPKVVAAKPVKPVKAEKSATELARIKEANLQRMKDITAKYGSRVAKPEGDGVDGFDSTKARAEVDNILTDDSFAAPEFLSRDQVRALV